MEKYLDKLNDKQREAVTTIDGPLLVLAGAGSGKTTVLANRIAYILHTTYARPWNILAITFTNKAANEMKERIGKIIGSSVQDMWVGTFHSMCIRILRKYISREGYTSDFIIYDTQDSRTLMKECMKQLNLDEKECPVRKILSIISNKKNNMIDADEFEANVSANNPKNKLIAQLYKLYQKKLMNNNALDFDDIILKTVQILDRHEDVATEYQKKFKYILVDEYQDTNNAQYALIGLLARGYGNICVVGDDDQSIYKFRGANVRNILDFPKDYKNARVIKLEQNYRSTQNILDAANSVIHHNKTRMDKSLWTSQESGELITEFIGKDERAEALYIVSQIRKYYEESETYKNCAILYRLNSQSRAIEDVLMKEAIPYKVLAGMRFYDRKEIKDITAYLRVVYNPHDDLSLMRIINEPKRKIGVATIEKIQTHAARYNISCYDVICHLELYSDLNTAAVRLKAFAEMIKVFRKRATEATIYELAKYIYSESGYQRMLITEDTTEAQTRMDNIEEYLNVIKEFSEDTGNNGALCEFLESITLVSDIDSYDQEQDYVVLMTIHSAKGLEFPIVFLVGMEENLFPGSNHMQNIEDIEEERRLCYVAITRAKQKLYTTGAESRFRFGRREYSPESRFLKEIPPKYKEDKSKVTHKIKKSLSDLGIQIQHERGNKQNVYKKKEVPPAVDAAIFNVGDRVRHNKFGEGTVISAQQFGRDAILVINFDTVGAKRLMAAFAKLERIE